MKWINYLIVLCLSLGTASAQESLELSLQDCIDYALQNNEDLEIARLEKEISQTQIDETVAMGLPQLNGNLGVTKNFTLQVSPIEDFISPAVYGVLLAEGVPIMSSEVPEPDIFPAAFGTTWTSSFGISARQLIFDGSYFVGLKAARAVKDLTVKEERVTEVQVVENVSKAYYLVLISAENLEFSGRNFGMLDTLLNETQAMYESGFAEKIDVSRIQIQHNNAKTALKNNTELLITSIYALKLQMGMPVETSIVLMDDLESFDVNEVVVLENEQNVFESRPEYDVLIANQTLIDLNIQNFRSQYLPNIYANYNIGVTNGRNSFGDIAGDPWFNYSNLGLTMSIPIFDGFSKSSLIQRNRIQSLQIDQGIDQLKNSISLEVTTAKINLENAKRDLVSQTSNIALSEEIYKMTKIKYQEGLGSNYEVVEANTSFKESQTNYLNALYGAITSQIELKKALGILNTK